MDQANKKIRVLHVLNDTNIGGAGTLLYNLKCAINRQEYEFAFAFPHNSELVKLFTGERIYLLNNGADHSVNLRAALEIKKIIKIEKPDIIHTHSSLFARVGARLRRFDKNRIVYTKHCVFDTPKFAKYKALRTIYQRADDALSGNVIAVAESAKETADVMHLIEGRICNEEYQAGQGAFHDGCRDGNCCRLIRHPVDCRSCKHELRHGRLCILRRSDDEHR